MEENDFSRNLLKSTGIITRYRNFWKNVFQLAFGPKFWGIRAQHLPLNMDLIGDKGMVTSRLMVERLRFPPQLGSSGLLPINL